MFMHAFDFLGRISVSLRYRLRRPVGFSHAAAVQRLDELCATSTGGREKGDVVSGHLR